MATAHQVKTPSELGKGQATFAPLYLFQDVPVVPFQSMVSRVAKGGPVWPNFDKQSAVRHCRKGMAVDVMPQWDGVAPDHISTPCVWGGFLDTHFGHLVCEHLTRLAPSLRERPDDTYLFIVETGTTVDTLAQYIWDLLAWYGLKRGQVRLVTSAVIVDELRVAPQGEQLSQIAPSPDYLECIEALNSASQLEPDLCSHLYVSRVGLLPKKTGIHAGESYLVSVLTRLGAHILDPATATVQQQIEAYAGAECLIFAEGSAVHGRQTLSWIEQDIHILRRRYFQRIAEAMIPPRCEKLEYHTPINGQLTRGFHNPDRCPGRQLVFYDVVKLFDMFASFNLDLGRFWDTAAYDEAVITDALAWIDITKPAPGLLLQYFDALEEAGLSLPNYEATEMASIQPQSRGDITCAA